jgi:nucleotide-binding universal stress UspA family protein
MSSPCVVAAVDLNARAEGVVRRAAKLAAMCQGALVIAHVVDHRAGYESDQVPLVPQSEVRAQMVRYARAWLVGLACHIDPAVGDVEIVVEVGRPRERLAALAKARHARYLLVGRSRWGLLSPVAGLVKALSGVGGCDVLAVGDLGPLAGQRLSERLEHWLSA